MTDLITLHCSLSGCADEQLELIQVIDRELAEMANHEDREGVARQASTAGSLLNILARDIEHGLAELDKAIREAPPLPIKASEDETSDAPIYQLALERYLATVRDAERVKGTPAFPAAVDEHNEALDIVMRTRAPFGAALRQKLNLFLREYGDPSGEAGHLREILWDAEQLGEGA